MKIPDCIKNIRLTLGLSQSEFSKLIDKDKSSVCMYENGKRKPGFPTIRKIVDLAKKHGIKVKYTDLRDD